MFTRTRLVRNVDLNYARMPGWLGKVEPLNSRISYALGKDSSQSVS
jgi:hypothetical protein